MTVLLHVQLKESRTKSSNFSLKWTKTLYQNNFKCSKVLFAFPRAKHINIVSQNNTNNSYPWEFNEINFKFQRNKLSVSFYQNFQLFHMNFKLCFWNLVLIEMISFEDSKQAHRSFQWIVWFDLPTPIDFGCSSSKAG